MSTPAIELVAACSGMSPSAVQLAPPKAKREKYGNTERFCWSVQMSLQSRIRSGSYWKTVSGLLHFQGWRERKLDDDFFDLFLTPYSQYKGNSYVPPSKSAKSRDIANALVPMIRSVLRSLIAWELADPEIDVALATPVWETQTVPTTGGDAFVYQGIITHRRSPTEQPAI